MCGGFSGHINSGSLILNNCYNIGSVEGNAGVVGRSSGGITTIYNTFIINKDENEWNSLTSGGWNSPTVNLNNFYYRETTFKNIGAGTINGTPVSYTDANMKLQSFVYELNTNIETGWEYEEENEEGVVETKKVDTTGWAKWVYNEDGYPTLDTTTTWNGTDWETN